MKRDLITGGLIFITTIFLSSPIFVFAQRGSVPSPVGSVRATVVPSAPTNAAVNSAQIATPRPIPPTIAPQATATASPSVAPTTSALPVESSGSDSMGLITIASAAVLGLLGMLGLKFAKKGGQQEQKKDEGRCDSIKQLLEQKKKELEETVKGWPEEKLKSIAQEKVIGELKKNEDARELIEIAEDLKSKYDKLQSTIEMLQKKYDLCMLSLPSGGSSYKGAIVENSLKDREILKDLKITKTQKLEDWIIHNVEVDQKQIEKMGDYLNDGPWYMHFWQEGKDDVTVVFKDKSFKIKYSDKNSWREAIDYGKSKGISEEQLDFTIQ